MPKTICEGMIWKLDTFRFSKCMFDGGPLRNTIQKNYSVGNEEFMLSVCYCCCYCVWHDYDGKISIFQQDLLWNESKMRTMRKSTSSSYLIPYLIHKFTFSIHNLEMEFCFNFGVCDYVVYNVICHFNTYSVLVGAFWQTQNVPYSCYQGRKKKNNNIRTFQLFDSVVWKSENISINYGIITIRFVCNGHSGLVFVHFDAKMCHMTIDILIESGK